MAVISVNTFLDGGTARTAGEVWNMNGGVLTIRTDTRWHTNAPAGMVGSLGNLTVSPTQGGGVMIDARNVREVSFNSGSGVVPAIGTTITQGGVSGYLLAVYSSLTSAPTTVGAAMPTTGVIKFREVTGGNFIAGALTGIGASATGSDVTSWIEVVGDEVMTVSVPRLGFFRTRGNWYNLGTTTGIPGQIFQVPTNGGNSGTHVPGIWVETSPSSNQYEFYPSVISSVFINTNIPTDQRGKFVETIGNGQIRIGNNGTGNVGFTPLTGCRVRVANIFLRNTSSANRALNLVPNTTLTTRPDFITASAGVIDMEYTLSTWYHFFSSAYQVIQKYGAVFDILQMQNIASPLEIEDFNVSPYTGTSVPLTMSANSLGGVISNCKFYRSSAVASGYGVLVQTCSDFTLNNVEAGVCINARSNTGFSYYIFQSTNIILNNCRSVNHLLTITTSFDCTVNNHDHTDRIIGTTVTGTPIYAVQIESSSDNILINGVTFGFNGLIPNVHPYNAVFRSSNSSNITFRNLGTASVPISGGTINQVDSIYSDGGVNNNVRVQRCYLTATRSNLYSSSNTSKNLLIENCVGTVGAIATTALNASVRSVRSASNSTSAQASVYGTHFFNMFYSDTTGGVWFAFNEPTIFNSNYVTTTFGTGAGFTSGGQASMPNIGDQIILESPYFIKGYTSFQNISAVITGTNSGNFIYEYAINTGTGYGVWKTLNGTNISSETITAGTGFKIKLRATTTVANSLNALTYVRISLNTTLSDQRNNLYPLENATINIGGLVSGSRVQLYDVTNSSELYNDITSTSLSFSSEYISDYIVRVRIMYQSGTSAKKFLEFTDTVTVNGLSRSVAQENDSIYIANGVDGSTVADITINDTALLVESDTGSFTWQELYAYETYWLQTEEGIRDEARFIEAVDQANYKLFSFNIKNITSPSIPLVISGGVGVDGITGEAIDVIDTSGGTIFCTPDRVVPFSTSGSVVISGDVADVWNYATRTLTSGGGGGGGGGATAEEIWEYPTRTITSGGITLSEIEASTVLAKETTSQAIKTKTDTLVNTNLTGIATSVNITDAVTAITGEIDLVKINTDLIPATL